MIWTQKTVIYTLVTKDADDYIMRRILYEVTNNDHYRWIGIQEIKCQGNELSHSIKEICNETGTYGLEVEVTPDLLKNDEQANFIRMALYQSLKEEEVHYH